MIKEAKFLYSNTSRKKIENANLPEIAVIGRSNVGKSSLINTLTNKKQLAKISARPGKTQLINHFLINDQWFLVDLPGYGWARASKTDKQQWSKMIEDYILGRELLTCLCILLDCRHEPQAKDLEFINWAGERQVPIILVFTKTDKLSRNQLNRSLQRYQNELLKTWEDLPPIFAVSNMSQEGKDELVDYFENIIRNWQ